MSREHEHGAVKTASERRTRVVRGSLGPARMAAFDIIAGWIERTGRAPSVREIGTALGGRSTNAIMDLLKGIEAAGLITRESKMSRGLKLTPLGEATWTGNALVGFAVELLDAVRADRLDLVRVAHARISEYL